MTNQCDQFYIDLTLSGDCNAFGALIERYKSLVFTVCVRMLKDTSEAEEVAQEAFLKGFQRLNNFKGKSKFSTWLYRIAYNLCLDQLSRKRRQPTYRAIDVDDTHIGNQGATIEDDLELAEIRAQLMDCIYKLNEKEAFIITLYYLEEQTIDEIALITGYSKSNVKVKLFRARKKLHEILVAYLPKEILEVYEG